MTRRDSATVAADGLVEAPGLRPAVALGLPQEVTGEQMLPFGDVGITGRDRETPMPEPYDEPTVTFRAVLDLIQAQRDGAAARCPGWRTCTTAEYLAGNYELLGAHDVLGRLEVAVLRLKEEALGCPPSS